jgi:hypothetical protein
MSPVELEGIPPVRNSEHNAGRKNYHSESGVKAGLVAESMVEAQGEEQNHSGRAFCAAFGYA